jgi:hypothetical protein
MAEKQAAGVVPPKHAYKPRGKTFQPTREQRAFVAAAAGLGVPNRVICQMMPGGTGEIAPINCHTLTSYFKTELRDGLRLATALVEARVYQRALSHDDRSALSAQALILNSRGGWKSEENPSLEDLPDPPLAMDRLTFEERDTLKKLLTKAMDPDYLEDSEPSADGDSRRRKRRHGNLQPR